MESLVLFHAQTQVELTLSRLNKSTYKSGTKIVTTPFLSCPGPQLSSL